MGLWRKRPGPAAGAERRRGSAASAPADSGPSSYTGDLATARRFLLEGVGQSHDFRLREFRLGGTEGAPALVGYLEGLADQRRIDSIVLDGPQPGGAAIWSERTYESALDAILEGNAALFVQGSPEVLVMGVARLPHRSVEKPETEHSVRGSREGFTELLGVNIALIRRRVRHPNLRITKLRVGKWSRTQVAVVHLEGLTNPQIVQTAMERLNAIEIDQVEESHSLEVFLQDHPFTPFPLIRSTERPDEAVRSLLSGKVLIMTDNTPFVLGVPSVFMDFYQTMEDYVFGFWGATLVRGLRLVAWATTFFLPALYISLIAVNPEMVPNELALTIASAREGLPFPPIIEVAIIEILVELIREAALRLPQPLGTTIGVVGGIVVGQAIVAAGVISPLMIIVAAVTMIASFTTPTIDMGVPWRILKWLLIFLAHAFGLLGVVIGAAMIFGHMANLTSFGVPYLSPFSPLHVKDLKDTLVRAPLPSLKRRPSYWHALQNQKLASHEQPAKHPNLREGTKPTEMEPDQR